MSSIEQYLAHSRRFGPACVPETTKADLSPADLLRLGLALGDKSVSTSTAVATLHADGLVPGAIANTLRLSDRSIRLYLEQGSPGKSRTTKNRCWILGSRPAKSRNAHRRKTV